jgi:hypothetical protein
MWGALNDCVGEDSNGAWFSAVNAAHVNLPCTVSLAALSPYITSHINRLGHYEFDRKRRPPELDFTKCLPLGAEAQRVYAWEEAPCFRGLSPIGCDKPLFLVEYEQMCKDTLPDAVEHRFALQQLIRLSRISRISP